MLLIIIDDIRIIFFFLSLRKTEATTGFPLSERSVAFKTLISKQIVGLLLLFKFIC
jgi:hypothetical protein